MAVDKDFFESLVRKIENAIVLNKNAGNVNTKKINDFFSKISNCSKKSFIAMLDIRIGTLTCSRKNNNLILTLTPEKKYEFLAKLWVKKASEYLFPPKGGEMEWIFQLDLAERLGFIESVG